MVPKCTEGIPNSGKPHITKDQKNVNSIRKQNILQKARIDRFPEIHRNNNMTQKRISPSHQRMVGRKSSDIANMNDTVSTDWFQLANVREWSEYMIGW
jgi:hypothetical protein